MSGMNPFGWPYFGEGYAGSYSSPAPTITSNGVFLPVLGNQCPYICVEIDWTNNPTSATQTWTDITPYVVAYSRQPVRVNEFDQPGPCGASITLRNDDARFTPDNTTGPYYGGLKPYRRVRVRALWNGTIYNRYWGFVTDWPQSWDAGGFDQSVTLNCVDNLTPLETYDLQGQSFASKLSGAAIQDVLTAAGATPSSLDPGNSTIVASGTLSTQSFALQRLKDISASENGVCYADGGGTINFHDRHRRLTGGASVNVQATIGDAYGEIPYTDPNPIQGDVWPIVQVTPNGGTVQRVALSSGTSSFFNRTLNFPTGGTYLVSDSGEALQAAQYLSNRFGSDPITRIQSVTLIGTANPNLWATILSLDVSQKVLFKRRFLKNGVVAGTISLTEFVEGYGDDVTVGQDWRVKLPLSPADIQSYWVLGDSVYGLLGNTTRLAY